MRSKQALVLLAISASLLGCAKAQPDQKAPGFEVVSSPAARGSGEPNFFVSQDQHLYMSWLEPVTSGGHALRFAIHDHDKWSKPRTIATGTNWFVNWADFPSLIAVSRKHLVAHWLAKSGGDTYAYDVQIVQSKDSGRTWSDGLTPHNDGTQTEHGFVSMVPGRDGRTMVAWLDGREFAKQKQASGEPSNQAPTEDDEMTLRAAFLAKDGTLSGETLLDSRVCDCCQTSAVETADGILVAYRDRSPDEIRDMSVVRFDNERWHEPTNVYPDQWEVPGCPVNGPMLAASNNDVVLAWFTNAREISRVKATFSTDGGKHFGEPVIIDDGDPIGRVDVLMLDDGSALVSWVEALKEGAEIRMRRVRSNGERDGSITVTETRTERASGFPQLARLGKTIYLAWTAAGDPSQIKVATLELD